MHSHHPNAGGHANCSTRYTIYTNEYNVTIESYDYIYIYYGKYSVRVTSISQ